ncbi:MAG: hypothetical protein WAW80_03385 [Candidatus Saccharimonadales bacterium]
MSETETSESSNRWGQVIELRTQQLIQIVLTGAIAGVIMWLLAILVRQIFFVPLFCGDPTNTLCVNAPATAGDIATILTAVIALLGLVRVSAYRPLIIVVAAAISLWGLSTLVAGFPWFEALAWSILLYAFTYALYAWIARIRSFTYVIGVILVVIILTRWLPVI